MMTEYIMDRQYDIANGTFSTVKREKIVRCRDCENYATDELGGYCTLLDFQDAQGMEDKFCAWAKRRDA